MKTKSIVIAGLSLLSVGLFSACEDMMNTPSSMVLFTDDQKLDLPTDTVYSVIGVIQAIQDLAVQNVLLGEIRGDLVDLTPQASSDLKELANFNVGSKNQYASASKYYSIINQCNFYLANVDTALKKRNEYVFMKEFAAIKTYRAWTYLQLATTYGTVPFVTTPVLSEADAKKTYPMYSIKQICDYFVQDLAPYISMPLPGYGNIGGISSKKLFLPTRVVLGDLCLWAERYQEAASYYHDYLNNEKEYITTGNDAVSWSNLSTDFINYNSSLSFNNIDPTEVISHIIVGNSIATSTNSELANIFNSTASNNYYNQVAPSQSLMDLSRAQSNCIIFDNSGKKDTLYSPHNQKKPLLDGDLRLANVYSTKTGAIISTDGNPTSSALYSNTQQTISKFTYSRMYIYRIGQIYLRYAEALNRAGYPQSAFAVLKYGLYPANVTRYVSADERTKAGNLIAFNQYAFSSANTIGIHSRGSGNAEANKYYVIPANVDTTKYVENLIIDENALETSFEGFRYYDLLRVALRRNDADWFATKIASRGGASNLNTSLLGTLKNDRSKWFLPLR